MSKFLTPIPVDIQSIADLLPTRASVLNVRFNRELAQVEIEWDDDDLNTGYTFAHPYPSDALLSGDLPQGVKPRTGYVHKKRGMPSDPKTIDKKAGKDKG